MIEFCNVKLGYIKEFYALYNLNLKVSNGEKVAIVGEQDAGKTSFLRLLAKLEKISSGDIYYNDVPLESIDYSKDLSVAYLAYKPILLNASVRKNLEYVLKIRKVNKEDRNKIIDKALEDFALTTVKDIKVKKISLYQQRLLQFAMISVRPKIDLLLVDDILNGLNDNEHQTIREILQSFMKKDTTTFYATGDINEAKNLCEKIVYLKLGAIDNIENNKLKISKLEAKL